MKYGGKANSLLYLASNNILVPKFFIITKDDYIMFLKANKIYTTIRDLSLEKKYQSIKELIMKQDINKELEVKIDRELPLLNGIKFAVFDVDCTILPFDDKKVPSKLTELFNHIKCIGIMP